MMQSVLILGRQPALGLAELESLYGAAAVTPVSARPGGSSHSTTPPHAAGLSLHAHDVNFARLGGSTRLAHVIAELPTTNWSQLARQLPELTLELALTLPPDGKIQLGLSVFGIDVSPARLNALGLTIKKTLRSRAGRSVRVTPNPTPELNTAAVAHNHLTGPLGIELLLIAHGSRTILARTTQVQDIDSYTLRDRGRPKRDARVGMLPPKLAQIIINLATGQNLPSYAYTVLDPFCGTGVVLQELMLMGYAAMGSDIDPRMGEYTTANLDWLRAHYPQTDSAPRSWQLGDATAITWETSKFTEKNGEVTDAQRVPATIHAVACETYLGRPFTARPSSELLAQTASEANLIIKKFLQNIHRQLAHRCVWPSQRGSSTRATSGTYPLLTTSPNWGIIVPDLSMFGMRISCTTGKTKSLLGNY
jgi:hypothetical protein